MSYSDGSFFGYDELFINPALNSYYEYNTALKSEKPVSAKYDNRALKDMYKFENKAPKPTSVYDYMKNARNFGEKIGSGIDSILEMKDVKIEELKKKASEFQHKNDMLLIFLIYLVIIIVVQYNMSGPSYSMPSMPMYNSPYIQYQPSAPPAPLN
jgi:hypothetical protein